LDSLSLHRSSVGCPMAAQDVSDKGLRRLLGSGWFLIIPKVT